MELFHGQGRLLGSKETAATAEVYGDSLAIRKPRFQNVSRFFKYKFIWAILGSVLFVIAAGVGALMIYTWDNHLLAKGVSIAGIDVGNLTKEQAKQKVESEVKKWLAQPVKLEVEGKMIELSLESLGTSVEIEKVLNDAYDVGRKGSPLEKAKQKREASYGRSFELVPLWDDQKITEMLSTQLAAFNKEPVDATFHINEQNLMEIQSEQVGRSVELAPLIPEIKKTPLFESPGIYQAGFKEEKPSVTAAILENEKIDGLVASYTTYFDPTQVERSENVRLAAKALDGALIKPGETLSFNEIVGERTVANGYKDAYIIVNGEFVPGLGGGICQVSSTLYNVGLLANLSIAQRSNHDLAITYVPLGQDATVAWPNLDLKMNNDTGGYLLVRTKTGKNTLTIDLYGKVKPGQQVLITDRTESVIPVPEQRVEDRSLAPGQEVVKQAGQPGYIVTTYRTVRQDGVVIKTEKLNESRYNPLPRIIAVGP